MTTMRYLNFCGILALLLWIGTSSVHSSRYRRPAPYSSALESQLRSVLFTNYSVLQRPSERVRVIVWLTLLTINEMNIKDQTLSVSGYFTLAWWDRRLMWYWMTDYTNVRFLFSTQQYIWRPPLVVDNSITDLSVISNNDIPMRIINNGFIFWSPADIYVVACESDITYYPMDIQSCVISLTAWAYTSYEVTLEMSKREIVTSQYQKNGEWELLSWKGEKTASTKSRGGIIFSNLKFSITLRRRPLFHILNTLFPVALMAILSTMVFKLPADSGEKIGFSLTVLLAYAVYLTLISENIPSTSVTVSYLSIYLSATLTFGTMAVLCTICVLYIHYKGVEGHGMSGCARAFTICLMRITCWNGCCRCKKRCKRGTPVTPQKKTLIHVIHGMDSSRMNTSGIEEPEVVEEDEECVCNTEDEPTWTILAKVLDCIFFAVFLMMILASSAAFFGVMTAEYLKIQAENNEQPL